MGTKNDPGTYDCYAAAEPDEPMFILLARDPAASVLVENWAMNRLMQIQRGERPEEDRAKVDEAFRCAKAMKDWYQQNRAKPMPIMPPATAA